MNLLTELANKVRRNDPLPLPWAMILSAITPCTRAGMFLRRVKPVTRVEALVVSFGNITVGGTGKTPAVIERAERETALGRKVAILTRGYGAPSSKMIIATPNDDRDNDIRVWLGDEPELIRKRVPGVIIGKGADRVTTARKVVRDFGCDLLILDDGFQYVQLHRDEDVVVLDSTNPFGNGWLLPRGILREPLKALSRATHILLTRCDQAKNLYDIIHALERYCPGVPIRKTYHAPKFLERVQDGVRFDLRMLQNERVTVACAIGNPDAFAQTVESLGAQIQQRLFYSDHARVPVYDLPQREIVVTTEKDAVKMRQVGNNVFAIVVALEDFI